MESGIVRIIKARIISIKHEIEEAKAKLNEKENELQLALLALNAIRKDNDTQSQSGN